MPIWIQLAKGLSMDCRNESTFFGIINQKLREAPFE